MQYSVMVLYQTFHMMTTATQPNEHTQKASKVSVLKVSVLAWSCCCSCGMHSSSDTRQLRTFNKESAHMLCIRPTQQAGEWGFIAKVMRQLIASSTDEYSQYA